MGAAGVAARLFGNGIRALGKAIYSVPIIGWIAAAIGALIALFTLLWNRSEKFRGFLFGLWGAVKAIFHNIGVFFGIVWENMIKPVFEWMGGIITWFKDSVLAPLGNFFGMVWNGIVSGLNWLGETFSGIWGWIGGILERVGLRFTSFWDFMKSLFVLGAKILFWPFTLLFKLFPDLGAWMEEKVWQPIKAVFEKIAQRLGKLIEPIKKIWGKLFKGEEYKDVNEEFAQNEEKGKQHFRDEKARKKTEQGAGIGDLMAGLEGDAPSINLNPVQLADDNVKGGKEKKGDTKGGGDNGLSLGIPQNYNQTNAYTAIQNKLGLGADPAMEQNNTRENESPTEKPVKSIMARVEEIAGSMRKMAAVAALPVALSVGQGTDTNSLAPLQEKISPAVETVEKINAPTANAVGNALYENNTSNENNLFATTENIANNYDNSSISSTEINGKTDVVNRVATTHNTNQGKTVRMDRFTDKIEIHVHATGTQAGKDVAENVRDEVEKALAEILNV